MKDCFPAKNILHVSRRGCDGMTTVTVSGSVKYAYVALFQWMVNSCQMNGRARIEFLSFSKYARLYEAAEALQVNFVRNEMLARMNRIADGQVPCEDVRMVYANYPKDHVIRQIVIRSIGDAILNRSLRRWALYLDLRVENIAYDNDIYEYVEAKRSEWREQHELERNKRKKNRRTRKDNNSQDARGAEQHQATVVEKQVAAPLARKGRGGKPSYYKIGLKDFGVKW
ncbi:hypothetical protein VTO42DRAFT_8954 [Malbranchea cinnamomea]